MGFCLLLGLRFGMIMMQVQLCVLIHNYNFQPVDQEIAFKQGTAFLLDSNAIHMRMQKRENR